MNNNDLLFSNKFTRTLDTDDISKTKVAKFAQFYEGKGDKRGKITQKPPINKESRTTLRKTLVSLDSSDRDKYKYKYQNDFEIFLGQGFKNVHSIKLNSTEIPNTDTAIKNLPVELKNNVVSWVNEEDTNLNIFDSISIFTSTSNSFDVYIASHGLTIGSTTKILIFNSKADTDLSITGILDGYREAVVVDVNTLRCIYKDGLSIQHSASINTGLPVYSVELIPGNYTANTITTQIETQLNKIKRRNGNGQFHFFVVSVTLDTNVITMESVITTQLSDNPISTIAGSTIITVLSSGHGYKTGDTVRMIDVQNTASISGLVLSGDFTITIVDYNTFTYEVNVPAVASTNGGGNNVKSGTMAPFKLLFETSDTLIQNNIGFLDEDSSISIGNTDPITTKVIGVSNIDIQNSLDTVIETTGDHGLYSSTTIIVSSIETGYESNSISITTSTPHGIYLQTNVNIRNTNSSPQLDGIYTVFPDGLNTLIIYNHNIVNSGNYGELVYGGDTVRLSGVNATPKFKDDEIFYVEEIVSSNEFKIRLPLIYVDQTFANSKVLTNQVFINQPSHPFNNLTNITTTTGNFVLCNTFLPHTSSGYYVTGVSIIDGPVDTNTIDILSTNHGLETSDEIIIKNSTTDPIVNGVYSVQVLTADELRVNFVHSSLVSGTGTIISGDTVVITNSDSFPRIDGEYSISNRFFITSIGTGVTSSTITTSSDNNVSIGDQLTISSSDSVPVIDGVFTVDSIINSTSFTILVNSEIINVGSTGVIINNNSFIIELTTPLTVSGTSGIISRNQTLSLYRVSPEITNGNNIGGIGLDLINNSVFSVSNLIDSNNYMIRIPGGYATSSTTSGGSDVTISSIGRGYRSHQSNTDTGLSDGSLSRSINLSGESYLLLQLPGISSNPGARPLYISSGIKDVFAKLLLKESPGLMVYDGHLSTPLVFDPLIPNIETLHLKTLTRDGYPFNYNNTDWSFSLEIIEVVDELEYTGLSSRTNNKFKN